MKITRMCRPRFVLWITLAIVMLGTQPVWAETSCPPYCSSGGGGGASSTAKVLMVAVGVAAFISSVDCASRYPSLPMCKPGGSLFEGSMTREEWGSMGSFIDLHDAIVAPK